jgi:hypothetical protein
MGSLERKLALSQNVTKPDKFYTIATIIVD